MAKKTPAWPPRQLSRTELVKALGKLGWRARYGAHPDVGLALHVLADALRHDDLGKLGRLLSEARAYAYARHGDRDPMMIGPSDKRQVQRDAEERALARIDAYLQGESEQALKNFAALGVPKSTLESMQNGSGKAHPRHVVAGTLATVLTSISSIQPELLDTAEKRKAFRARWLDRLTRRLPEGKGDKYGKRLAVQWASGTVWEDACEAAGLSKALRDKIQEAKIRRPR